jgi:hypothetical protein
MHRGTGGPARRYFASFFRSLGVKLLAVFRLAVRQPARNRRTQNTSVISNTNLRRFYVGFCIRFRILTTPRPRARARRSMRGYWGNLRGFGRETRVTVLKRFSLCVPVLSLLGVVLRVARPARPRSRASYPSQNWIGPPQQRGRLHSSFLLELSKTAVTIETAIQKVYYGFSRDDISHLFSVF